MEEHTWKQFLYLREKGDDLNHLYRTVLLGLCLLLANYLISLSKPDLP